MIKQLLRLTFVVFGLNSCTTTIVNKEKPYADSKLQLDRKYTILTQDEGKKEIRISKIDSAQIFGKDNLGKSLMIEKSKIISINKPNTLGTIGIVVGVAAAVLVIPAYAGNKPVGQ